MSGSFAAAATVAVGWRTFGLPFPAFGAPPPAPGYGPLGAPDANGVRLPPGFTARLLARTGERVLGTDYVWHPDPDGAATFATDDGGWILVSNSEDNGNSGGASAIRFDSGGEPATAYRILSGTKWNCAGGATPWGTWLSCEEFRNGLVWECDPFKPSQGVARPALGVFIHEAAPVDARTGYVYLTEDDHDGRLYRFLPDSPCDLGSGALEVASVAAGGAVSWIPVSPKRPYRKADATVFDRGEGAWISRDVLYFSTTANDRVWALDLIAMRIRVIYDGQGANAGDALHEPDNVTVHERTGDGFVAEDADDIQLVQLVQSGETWTAAPFLQFAGHDGSEVTGPVFSPDGSRLYVTSQRGTDGAGMTFEVTGPFATR
jgi:secreted PhoX family phosphatase